MISQIINTKERAIPVKNVGLGENNIFFSSAGEVAPSTEVVVFENTKPSIIEFLEVATNYNAAQFLIQFYNGSAYESIGQIKPDGSGTSGLTPVSIAENGFSLFQVNAYSNTNFEYKFSLARPLHFAKGVRIVLRNTATSTTKNLACRGFGREL